MVCILKGNKVGKREYLQTRIRWDGEIFSAWLPAGRTASPGKALASPKCEQNEKKLVTSHKESPKSETWGFHQQPKKNKHNQASALETWLQNKTGRQWWQWWQRQWHLAAIRRLGLAKARSLRGGDGLPKKNEDRVDSLKDSPGTLESQLIYFS